MKKLFVILILICTNLVAQAPKKHQLLFPYRDGNLWGLCDSLGVVKVKPFAKEIIDFIINDRYYGKYIVKEDSLLSVIDNYKKKIVPPNKYDSAEVSKFKDEVVVYKDGKSGIIKNKKKILPIEFDKIYFAENKSYKVSKDNKLGIYNNRGKLIIPIKYTYVSGVWNQDANSNLYKWSASIKNIEDIFFDDKIEVNKVENNENVSFLIDSSKENVEENDKILKILQDKYNKVVELNFWKSFAIVENNNKLGVFSTTKRKEIISTLYDEIKFMGIENNVPLFLAKKDNNFGIIYSDNEIKIPFIFDNIYELSGNVYILEKSNVKGIYLLNTLYNTIYPKYKKILKFDFISINQYYSFYYFLVETTAGKTGYVGENGIEYFKN